MERLLVVARESEAGTQLLRDAGRHAAGIGAALIVLSVVDESSYTGTLQRSNAPQSDEIESIEALEAEAERAATELAAEALADIDVDYEVVSRMASLPGGINEFAEERDCDHIYIVGDRRSPAGKVIFGDVAQSVLLNFDGPVTIRTEPAG